MIPVRATLQVQTNLPNSKLKVQTNNVQNDVSINTEIIVEGSEPYTGDYEVTPTQETQILYTNDLRMTDNVTVNPIPSQYVDVTDTTATASDVLSGVYFYTSSGVYTEGSAIPASATVVGTKLILTDGFPINV